MSVPTMEELGKVFWAAWEKSRERQDTGFRLFSAEDAANAGLLAVLDRLKPVVAEALIEANGITQYSIGRPTADARATRIIDQIKGAEGKK